MMIFKKFRKKFQKTKKNIFKHGYDSFLTFEKQPKNLTNEEIKIWELGKE